MTRFSKLILITSLLLIALVACKAPLSTTLLTVNTSNCVGCGECEEVCPYDAIEVIDGDAVINPTLCHQCNRCVEVCPEGAIY